MWIVIISVLALAGAIYIVRRSMKDAKEIEHPYYSSMEENEMFMENDYIDDHSPLSIDVDKTLKDLSLRNKLNEIEKKRKRKKMKTLLILILFCIPLSGTPPLATMYIERLSPVNPYDRIFAKVCRVESNFNSYAVNLNDPRGGSWGIVQIGSQKLSEYNEANGTNYGLIDLFNVELSKRIFIWHCMKYQDLETACREWNGGSNGMNMESTKEYWQKIRL